MVSITGSHTIEMLTNGLTLEHGNSLELMLNACECINDEFESEPESDWEAWANKGSFVLYYAVIRNELNQVCCAMRTVLDYVDNKLKRILIDYVRCEEECRGKGLASVLIQFIQELSQAYGANVFVVATNDSVPFWTTQGYVLDESLALNHRFNVFTDTTLMKSSANIYDPGEEEDILAHNALEAADEETDEETDEEIEEETEETEETEEAV
jgi:GNAT superfamily N-acetyltransferase